MSKQFSLFSHYLSPQHNDAFCQYLVWQLFYDPSFILLIIYLNCGIDTYRKWWAVDRSTTYFQFLTILGVLLTKTCYYLRRATNILLVESQWWKFLSNLQKVSYPTLIWRNFYSKFKSLRKIKFSWQNFMNCDRKTCQISMG